MEGNLRFKIGQDSLIVGRKFTVFALFYFVFEGNFQVQAPRGLIFGGAYFWNFTVFLYPCQFYLQRVLLLTSLCYNKYIKTVF